MNPATKPTDIDQPGAHLRLVSDRAGSAERRGLDHGLDLHSGNGMRLRIVDNCTRMDAEAEHDSASTEAVEPVQQMIEIGAAPDRRQQLWRIAENGANARSKPTGEHEHVNRIQTIASGRRDGAHAPYCPGLVGKSKGFGRYCNGKGCGCPSRSNVATLPTDVRNMLAPRHSPGGGFA